MPGIALYEILRKIPNVSAAEAKEAVADITNARDVATKADIAATKADIAEIKAEFKYTRWFIVIVVSIAVAFIKYLP